MNMKHIDRFGVELEGGWDIQPPLYAANPRSYHEDGSVYVTGRWRAGEIVSIPMSTWNEGNSFMMDNYPQHVGGSCGMHVHMSFKNNPYVIALLADDKGYQDGLIDTLTLWGKKKNVVNNFFWSRLAGENQYCKLDWDGVGVRGQERYRAVNFTAYSKHTTIEIRILPMFRSKKLAASAVKRVIAYTDWYINKLLESAQPEIEYAVIVPQSAPVPETPIILQSEV